MHIFKTISDDLHPFLVAYQTEAPMITLLCEDWCNILMLLMKRFIKRDKLEEVSVRKLAKINPTNSAILLQLKDLDIGFSARSYLYSTSLTNLQRMQFRGECQVFL